MTLERLPSGCQGLDRLLGGGFDAGIITQIFGESGSGKTNIMIQLCVQAVSRGLRVIYIDTEGFSADRFSQIAGPNAREIASKIMIFEPLSLEQQAVAIREASRIIGGEVGLIVVDSATSLYRAALEAEDSRPALRALNAQLSELVEIARRHRVPVVITNQVYTEIESGRLRPIGGTAISHLCKTIVALERIGGGRRRARLEKHRSLPEGETAEFILTASGVV